MIEKPLHPVAGLLDKASWLALFIMMMMTAIDVFLRNFTNASILGTIELTELLMVIVVFGSLAQCEVANGHIRVHLIMEKMGPRFQALAEVFTQALATFLFSFMTYAMYKHASGLKLYREITMDLSLKVYPFGYVAFIGCVVITLLLFSKTIISIIKAVKS